MRALIFFILNIIDIDAFDLLEAEALRIQNPRQLSQERLLYYHANCYSNNLAKFLAIVIEFVKHHQENYIFVCSSFD